MSASLTTFRRLAPDLAAISDADVESALSDAAALLNSDPLGACFAQAAVWLAAHQIEVGQRIQRACAHGSGAIVSETGGAIGTALGYSSTFVASDPLARFTSTPYGVAFAQVCSLAGSPSIWFADEVSSTSTELASLEELV